MFVSIINDCSDGNAMNRQASRYASFLKASVFPLGIHDFGDSGNGELEAAGNLIDALDATGGQNGVVVVNVAVRHGKGKKWPNGTPFAYFYYRKTLVISSIDGYCLSLVKKLRLTQTLNLLDVPTVIDAMIEDGHCPKKLRKLVVDSQFRSYEFVPRVAKWLMEGVELPYSEYSIDAIPDVPASIWWVDNFGNTVTTLLPEDIGHKPGKKIKTKYGMINCYDRLKDVPNKESGLIVGSWGIDLKRFVSFVIQGASAANMYKITSGSPLF